MRITERKYFTAYLQSVGKKISTWIDAFDFSDDNGKFDFQTKASAIYSSNIEGNTIDLNSFMNYELNKGKFKAEKEIEEIENLIEAYKFAQQNPLTESHLLDGHKTLSATFLIKSKRGKYRIEPVGVFGKTGLVYMTIEPEFIQKEMTTLFTDIEILLAGQLSKAEVFYFAALIHLKFVHIHPFRDGNGRAARLLEKWFIAESLGYKFWKIPSEEYYKLNQAKYYETLNLGVNYYELNYDDSSNFLEMLPHCLE